jgi:hypothetical protein
VHHCTFINVAFAMRVVPQERGWQGVQQGLGGPPITYSAILGINDACLPSASDLAHLGFVGKAPHIQGSADPEAHGVRIRIEHNDLSAPA